MAVPIGAALVLVATAIAGAITVRPAPVPPPRPFELGGQPSEGSAPAAPPTSAPLPGVAAPGTARPGAAGPSPAPSGTKPSGPPVAGMPGQPGCLGELRKAGAVAEVAPQPGGANAACQIEMPVRLSAVADLSGRPGAIALPERPVIDCRLALAFAAWVGRVAAPILAARRKADLKSVRTGPGFECRPRNRQPGAKMSAHGQGLAIDVAGFEFASGPAMTVETAGRGEQDPAFAAVRASACGWFTTVLGPGSDPFHSNHLHVDLQQHGSSGRYRICQ